MFHTRHRTGHVAQAVALALAITLLLLLVTGVTRADPPTFNERRDFGDVRGDNRALAVGDLNGDGYLDLVTASVGEAALVYLNDGRGQFQEPVGFGRDPSYITTLALGDLDGDSTLDIATAGLVSFNSEGTGRKYTYQPYPSNNFSSIALADVTGDGLLDILGGVRLGRELGVHLFVNDATHIFTSSQIVATGYIRGLAVGHLNGDGIPDLVTLDAEQYLIRTYFGNEAGAEGEWFTLQQDAFSLRRDNPYSIALADVDGENGPDIITGGRLSQLRVYLNDGSGHFSSANTVESGAPTRGRQQFRALSLADFDGDGDVDVAVGNDYGANSIFYNDGSGHFTESRAVGLGPRPTYGLAAGDFNADGHVDLAVGNRDARNELFINDAAGQFVRSDKLTCLNPISPVTSYSAGCDLAGTLALLADLDQNGWLDLITTTTWDDAANPIHATFFAAGAQIERKITLSSTGATALAAADVTGDGVLDVIALMEDGNRIFPYNLAAGAFDSPLTFGDNGGQGLALAHADIDGDGDIDLIVSHLNNLSQVLLNDGAGGFATFDSPPAASSDRVHLFGKDAVMSYALSAGDVNGDGAVDIVASEYIALSGADPTQWFGNNVYLNDGLGGFDWPGGHYPWAPNGGYMVETRLADMNGDGALDVVAVNNLDPGIHDLVFLNDGEGHFDPERARVIADGSLLAFSNLAVGDMDGDGDLDVVGREEARGYVFLNDGAANFTALRPFDSPHDGLAPSPTLLGDFDHDGDLDILATTFSTSPLELVWNEIGQAQSGNAAPTIYIDPPDLNAHSRGTASATVLSGREIPIRFTLADAESDAVGFVRACFSLDGGDNWRYAVRSGETPPAPGQLQRPVHGCPFLDGVRLGGGDALAATPAGSAHTFVWDTLASGFVGQSDNVVFRIEVYPDTRATPHTIAQPGVYPYTSAVTPPFRLRGLQVQVWASDEAGNETPAANAIVYRLPAGQATGAKPIANAAGVPLRTNSSGYLQGRGDLALEDQIVALLPVAEKTRACIPAPGESSCTGRRVYALYHSSAQPTETGLAMQRVSGEGLQKLVVSPRYPLYLFDLDVSLEWDARNDGGFLDNLEQAILRASEVFFDVSDGQMALGEVRIHQARAGWEAADAVIFAANNVHPRASMGGMVDEPTADLVLVPGATAGEVQQVAAADAFLPGQIRMGPLWDPFGKEQTELNQDWWNAFAHEFGHYFLFLPDNYLGIRNGLLSVEDCVGSFMTTAYDTGYSEFLTAAQWQDTASNCAATLAQIITGRSDWETIGNFYPAIRGSGGLSGPRTLPLAVTEITQAPLATAADTLPARFFDLRAFGSKERLRVAQGRAFLFQKNGHENDPSRWNLIDLGATSNSDRIKVRGARPDDRLCVFDNSAQPAAQIGCIEALDAVTSTLDMRAAPDWRPAIEIEPSNLIELAVTVTIPYTGADPVVEIPFHSAEVTPTVTITQPATAGQPSILRVVERDSEYEITPRPGQPYELALLQPGLNVIVRQQVPAGSKLMLQLFPGHAPPDPAIPALAPVVEMQPHPSEAGAFAHTFALDYPVFSGHVRVWLEGAGARREAISEFFISPNVVGSEGGSNYRPGGSNYRPGGSNYRPGGSNYRPGGSNYRPGGSNYRPGGSNYRPGGSNYRPGGSNYRPGGSNYRPGGANQRTLGAPVASADGQVTIFSVRDLLCDTGTSTLQGLPVLPDLPDWLTPVGQGYRFLSHDGAADAAGENSGCAISGLSQVRSIAFSYLQRNVPRGYEHTLRIFYHSEREGDAWTALPTALDTDENLATAAARGPGLYALIASVEVTLSGPGWNLFAYPIPEPRPITEALAPLAGRYSLVYGYDNGSRQFPWRVYDPSLPAWVRTQSGLYLDSLEPDNGYWIYLAESGPQTLRLRTPLVPPDQVAADLVPAVIPATPPPSLDRRTPSALFYGDISGGRASAGQILVALVGDTTCGSGTVLDDGGALRYAVMVQAAAGGRACGVPGTAVSFRLDQTPLAVSGSWDNTAPQRLDLR